MPGITQTVINIVNRGLNKVPSEYLRMERVTLPWSRGNICRGFLASMGKWAEKLIPCRGAISKAREVHVSDGLQFVAEWWSALGQSFFFYLN